ncbi:MAG: DUF6438 domain-containing protein [Flavobacteriales bacterium]|jgi:hypothetical protein|tara:strand:- start:191 stop:757 length:567 start_codon:yes stop_codon:yes gene_type:complete
MNKTLSYISLFLLALTIHACGLKNASESSEEIVEGIKIDTSLTLENLQLIDSVDELVSVTSEPLLTYRRTYCFGMCPVFKSSISQEGLVSYEGINFVDKMGKYEAMLTAAQIDSIIQRIHDVNYFALDSIYDNEYVMDLPSIISSVNLERKSHNILDRYESPRELKKLYKELDDTFATLEWKPAIETE